MPANTPGRLRSEWMELVFFANEVAMAYRRKNEQLRGEIADLHRSIEIYRKMIADFERQRDEVPSQSTKQANGTRPKN